jgi:hypothetical protein
MKKRFSLFLAGFLLLAVSLNAQRSTVMGLTAGDTAVDGGTASKIITVTGGPQGIAIQAKLTKIDGTVGGTLGVYGSGDGVTYDLIGSTFTPTNVASQQKSFYIAGPLPQYIKVMETGTGTMRAIISVVYRMPYYQGTKP